MLAVVPWLRRYGGVVHSQFVLYDSSVWKYNNSNKSYHSAELKTVRIRTTELYGIYS
jgi:hypothetical protein